MTITKQIWESLCHQIRCTPDEAILHPALELRGSSLTPHQRGVFASSNIRKGELLIRLPMSCAIHGKEMSSEYSNNETKYASTWLRCLAAFYRYCQNNKNDAYLASLPAQFETLWSWSPEQVHSFLAGTTVKLSVDSMDAVKARYQEHVRAYLEQQQQQCGDSDFETFVRACQIISTRAFHLKESQDYPGPFLLPVIDLLNHTSVDPATTLQLEQDAFVMRAERDIPANSEIKHSYGTELTASQSLQTFGFVAHEDSIAILEGTVQANNNNNNCTPAVVSKQAVLEASWNVMESHLPEQLAKSMEEMELDDEVWDMPTNYRDRSTDFLPDDIVVTTEDPLSDALVTAACLSFLPNCAYQEAKLSLLDSSLLHDYYLGKLVATSLLQVISDHMAAYKNIVYEGIEYTDDRELLRKLLDATETLSVQQRRLVYGLTVRLQEKHSWNALRRKVCELLTELDEEEDPGDENNKKQRMDESE